MPIYVYSCKHCKSIWEEVRSISNRRAVCCGEEANRIPQLTSFRGLFHDYYNDSTGTVITSWSEQKKLHAPDEQYVEKKTKPVKRELSSDRLLAERGYTRARAEREIQEKLMTQGEYK